jgi:hypothetical protein
VCTGLSGALPSKRSTWLVGSAAVLAALGKRARRRGYNSPDCPVCTGLSGEPASQRLSPAPNGRAQSTAATWQACRPRQRSVDRTGHVRCAPDCSVCQARWDGQRFARALKERNRALLDVRCAPDSPVHPRTEGNQGLPNEGATAPLALGAINRAPMRLYQIHKHTLSTLQLRDSATTLLNC